MSTHTILILILLALLMTEADKVALGKFISGLLGLFIAGVVLVALFVVGCLAYRYYQTNPESYQLWAVGIITVGLPFVGVASLIQHRRERYHDGKHSFCRECSRVRAAWRIERERPKRLAKIRRLRRWCEERRGPRDRRGRWTRLAGTSRADLARLPPSGPSSERPA